MHPWLCCEITLQGVRKCPHMLSFHWVSMTVGDSESDKGPAFSFLLPPPPLPSTSVSEQLNDQHLKYGAWV